MNSPEVLVGIDTGMDQHQVFLKKGDGQTSSWSLSHRHEAFFDLKDRLIKATDGQLDKVLIGLEGHSGNLCPLDRYLDKWGCQVVNVDARKLSLFRDMYGAPCKTDIKDAALIVHLLSQGQKFFRDGTAPYHRVNHQTASRRQLKKLSRYQQTLIEEKTRLTNRMSRWIHEICPELLELSSLKNSTVLRMLKRYPNVRGLARVSKKGLCSIKGIGTKTAEKFYAVLQNIEYDSEMVKVYETMIGSTAGRILELRQQIWQLDKKLEALGEDIESVQYLISLPGCGVKLASRLIGEIQSVSRFESHNQLAVYLGIACVDQQSGKTDYAKPVFPANTAGKHAMMSLAHLMVRNDSESKKYYQKKRAEGNDHSDALRRTARQIVKIIFRLLVEKREYVPYYKHSNQKEEKIAA